jgi:hypothetical protein
MPGVRVLILMTALSACGKDEPAAPTVVATPAPTPTPTPTPVPLGQGMACGLARRSECGREEGPPGVWGCCTRDRNAANGRWDAEIWDAINILQREQPELFNGDRVLDREKYQLGVASIVERKYGLCAIPGGPGDEIGVKDSNDANQNSEQYDIYESSGRVRYPGYQVTCTPARF